MNDLNIIKQAQGGSGEALEQLVNENTGLVWSVVRRFMGRGCEAEDLAQIGSIGLIKAVKRFDESYGVKFSTYAVSLIMGEIKRFLRDDGMIKVSRKYKELSVLAAAARNKLASELGRTPVLSELAAELGVDMAELTEALEACSPCDSIYKTVTEGDTSDFFLIDKLSETLEDDSFDKLSLSCAIDRLSDREKLIVKMRYFLDKTQCQVAQRLGISQVQVSRIEKRALSRLKEECV